MCWAWATAREGLMAAHYHPTDQQCVDKATIAAVAARRRLAVDQLNWCETNVGAALSDVVIPGEDLRSPLT